MLNLAIRNRFHRSSPSLAPAAMDKSQPDVGVEDIRTPGGVLALCDMSVFKAQAVSPVFEHLRGTAGFALMRAAAASDRLQKNNIIKSSQDGLATATEVLEAPSLPYLLTLESLAPRARLYGFKLPRATGLQAEGSLCLRQCTVPTPLFVSASHRYDIAFVTVKLELVAGAKGLAIIWRFDLQVYSVYQQVVYAGSRLAAHIMVAELQDTFSVIDIVFGLATNKSLESDLSSRSARATSHEVVVHAPQSLQDADGLFDSRPRCILDSDRMLLEYPASTCGRALPPAHDPVAAVEQFKAKFKAAKLAGGARRPIRSSKKKKENISKVANNKKRSDRSNSTVDVLQVPHLIIVLASDFSALKPSVALSIAPARDLPVSRPNICIVPNFLAIVALVASFDLACIIVFVSVTTSITPITKTVIKASTTKTVENTSTRRIAPVAKPVSPPCTNFDSHSLAYNPSHPLIAIFDRHSSRKFSVKPARIIAGARRTSARRLSKAPSGGALKSLPRKSAPPRGAPSSTRRPLASLQNANATPRPAASPMPGAPAPDMLTYLTMAWAPPVAQVADAYPAPTRPAHPAITGLQATMDSILAHGDAGEATWSTPFSVGPAQLPICAPVSNPQAVNRSFKIAPSCDPRTPINREEPVLQQLPRSPSKNRRPPYRNTLPSVQMKQLCAIRGATSRA